MTLFVIFLFAYVFAALRVREWADVAALGFKLNTPQGFQDHPRRYTFARTALFTAALASPVITGGPPLTKTIPVLLMAWFACRWIGRSNAFESFRDTHKDLLEYEEGVSARIPAESKLLGGDNPVARRVELTEGATISNKALRERLRLLNGRGV